MSNHIALAIVFIITGCTVFIVRELLQIEQRQIKRQRELEKWLFNSLYSINNKVLLPSEHEKPIINKKASVYVPGKDPMAEFNGQQDDWHD